jgi:predicted acetyltransferase
MVPRPRLSGKVLAGDKGKRAGNVESQQEGTAMFRRYDPERDLDAVRRIWTETGWLEPGKEKLMDMELAASTALVAELEGSAECLVLSAEGTVRHLRDDLPFWGVMGVTTSRVARKQRLASRLTAAALAEGATQGKAVAGLGMFEQGYYNRLGFGTGSYVHRILCDPTQLRVPVPDRVPRRLSADDWELMHNARLARWRCHGAVNFAAGGFTQAATAWPKHGFGLGFEDADGTLTHHFWCATDNVARGPYGICWSAWQTPAQYLELLGLIRSFGDQVRSVRLTEPAGIQLQDLLDRPFREYEVREKGKFELRNDSYAFWQMRMLDVPTCLRATHLKAEPLRFNLTLTDPVEAFLDTDSAWRGCGGSYVVTLGPESSAVEGSEASLPTLDATINAFTRLWLGVRPASGLAVTEALCAPPELLEALDDALRIPQPLTDWEF